MEMDDHVWDFHGKSQRYGSLFLKQLFPLLFFFANLAGIAWANSIIESVIGDEKDDRMR